MERDGRAGIARLGLAAAGVAGAAGIGAWAVRRARPGGHEARARQGNEAISSRRARVVILGAGFAGLTAARALAHRVGDQASVTLVDRHNYHLFTPLLYQVATCGVDPYDIAYPVRQFAGRHGVDFRRGRVTGVDFDGRCVHLDGGAGDQTLAYDYLVVALGSTTNFFGNRGASEHALALKWLEDGIAVRHRVIDSLERAAVTPHEDERRALLTFVVVGGGATGVETAAALADLLHQIIAAEYPGLSADETRVLVIEGSGKLLGHMDARMAGAALDTLRAKGVEVWLNARAKDVEPDRVVLDDGRNVTTRTVVWATGVRAPEVVAHLDASHGQGGSLAVNEFLQVEGHLEVFAAGDNAHYENPQTHQPAPLLAAAAVQMGAAAGENLARSIRGEALLPFSYRSFGTAVSLGRNAGSAEFGGIVVNGLAGWLVWRAIHLAKITGFQNRLRTALDWSLGYLNESDTARLEVQEAA